MKSSLHITNDGNTIRVKGAAAQALFDALTKKPDEPTKVAIGPSTIYHNPTPKPGYAVWIESGIYYTAPKVSPKKFGPHAYANGGYDQGIRDCQCGCHMASSSSGGPVDPFGACPSNPK